MIKKHTYVKLLIHDAVWVANRTTARTIGVVMGVTIALGVVRPLVGFSIAKLHDFATDYITKGENKEQDSSAEAAETGDTAS